MLSEVSQMVADREAGTPGPWRFALKKHAEEPVGTLFGANDAQVCDFGDATTYYPSEGKLPSEEDQRRIIRVPDLEAAYLTLAAENATLRASEAAALERVEKALETAKTRHIGDQPSYSSASDLGWAHQEYASLRRDIIAALTPTADRTEYERKVAQMKEDFPNGI